MHAIYGYFIYMQVAECTGHKVTCTCMYMLYTHNTVFISCIQYRLSEIQSRKVYILWLKVVLLVFTCLHTECTRWV